MNQKAFLSYLKEYQTELKQIISRFTPDFHIYPGDDKRLHEIAIELRDLCDDALGSNSYSNMIINEYNFGTSNFTQSPSHHSVQKIIGIVNALIKRVERNANLLDEKKLSFIDDGLPSILHPTIIEHAYQQYKNGHYRDAVLNSIVAVFDFIRERTGLKDDGDALISKVLSTSNPYLILSELETDSGRNDQVGFMQIYKGAYQGIRSPKAHSLLHDINKYKAAQYLVFASLLVRRIEDASLIKKEDNQNSS